MMLILFQVSVIIFSNPSKFLEEYWYITDYISEETTLLLPKVIL